MTRNESKPQKAVIKKHDCKSEFQDKIYGLGMRLMNPTMGKTSGNSARCTVCGKLV